MAYAELEAARRRLLHRRVVAALSTVHAADLSEVSGQLAVHYERAAMPEPAILSLIRAAQRAQLIYAYAGAFRHLNHALHLLTLIPSALRRKELECDVQMALGATSILPRGFAAAGVAQAFARAGQLGRELGATQQVTQALAGLSVHYLVKGDQLRSEEHAQEILVLVRSHGLAQHELVGDYLLGATSLFQGNLGLSRYHLQHAVDAYQPVDVARYLATYGYDPGIAAMSYLPLVLWLLGYQDAAFAQDRAVQQILADNADPHNAIFANSMAVVLFQLHGDQENLQHRADRLIRDAAQHGAVQWEAHGHILRGWLLAMQGEAEGVAEMEQGLAHWQMTGAMLAVPYYLTMLAQAYGRIGRHETALEKVAQATAVMNSGYECWYQAEILRRKGDLLLALGEAPDLAERAFLDALGIAERQGAQSLKVQAVQSLIALMQQQGRHLAARELVADVYAHGAGAYGRNGLHAVDVVIQSVQ
ncbi:MAG: hypothetical protein R2873_10945 [Caldilineaceae bacterium]